MVNSGVETNAITWNLAGTQYVGCFHFLFHYPYIALYSPILSQQNPNILNPIVYGEDDENYYKM